MSISSQPVLIFAFKRRESLSKLLSRLNEASKRQITISVDALPGLNTVDPKVFEIVEGFVATTIHDVIVKYREVNLGLQEHCRLAMSEFFSKHSSGIVLDDDILPSVDFFRFQDMCLNFFEILEDVYFVNSWTPFLNHEADYQDIILNDYFVPWGWGTWASKILPILNYKKAYSFKWILKLKRCGYIHNVGYRLYWHKRYSKVFGKKFDNAWDWEFQYALWSLGGRCVSPLQKRVVNLGFDLLATHEHKSNPSLRQKEQPTDQRRAENLRLLSNPKLLKRFEALMWDLGFQRIKSSMRFKVSRFFNNNH